MTALDVPTLSRDRMGGFYVPRFEIKIAGVGLPDDVLRDVIEVTYKDSIKEIDSVELTINNWDPAINNFKYAGAETAEDLASKPTEFRRYKLFEPCYKKFELSMGYLPSMTSMMTGQFTTMEPTFPSGGSSTLTVRGLNALHTLRRKQYTTCWENKKDSEVAKNIATLKDKGENRFELPVEIDEQALGQEEPIPYLAQENQYDIDFLLYRAAVRGYVVYVSTGSSRNRKTHLYFGPSESGKLDETYLLEWRKSLIDFRPTLTTARQVRSVTVNGWDRKTKKVIVGKADLDDLRQNRDLHYLLEERCDAREEVVVNRPVSTKREADSLALALLKDRHKEMVKASGTTVGLPDLRAGRKVQIEGLGARFSGTYFVTESTHTINDNGYLTKFKARREDEEKGYQGVTQ